MKKLSIFIGITCLCAIWILNVSFKSNSELYKVKSALKKDTATKSILSMYQDSTLYSGYFGNFADFPPVLKQMLDPKRIDNHLKKPLSYYRLTEKDKKNYILSIDQKAIKLPFDTIIRKEGYQYISLPVMFTNYSTDTLKYINMDCSWTDIYFTNNRTVQFDNQLCFKNEPTIKTVFPKQTITIYFPIVINLKERKSNHKFRIGMSLQKLIIYKKPYSIEDTLDFPFDYYLRPETSNMIWSNEVEIKARN